LSLAWNCNLSRNDGVSDVLYETAKCPHCGAYIHVNKPTGVNDVDKYVGKPTRKCRACFQEYQTGRKYWHEMSGGERTFIYFLLAFNSCYTAVMYSVGVMVVLAMIFSGLSGKGFGDFMVEHAAGMATLSIGVFVILLAVSTCARIEELRDIKNRL
jgi:hypothetical protein